MAAVLPTEEVTFDFKSSNSDSQSVRNLTPDSEIRSLEDEANTLASSAAPCSFTSLLGELTLEEKLSLLSGTDFVSSSGVARLDIPSLKVVDSVNGVKGSEIHHGTPTAVFPSSTLYGSTWNNSLMEELGQSLANQAKLKSAQVILGPTINIHRDPRGGRNFECFSEDPLLSGQLAAAIVRGIQSQGLAACPKHFACNESEFKRRQYNVAESPNSRTVREIYLGAFQELLRSSNPHGLMVSYNKLNGTHTTENSFLKDILRDQWDYHGCLISDWFATKSGIASVNAGLDLEMPGPAVFRGARLAGDVKEGRLNEKAVDECVSRVLALIDATQECHSCEPERSEINPETNALALKIASEGIILLKNERNVLPLDMRQAPKIAVIGAPATEPIISGGGSANAPPQYLQKPLDCLMEAHPIPDRVQYSQGVKTDRVIPMMPLDQTQSKDGRPGFDVTYFNHGSDVPVYTEQQKQPLVAMVRVLKPGLKEPGFTYEISTTITPNTTGPHTLAARVTGAFSLIVGDKVVLSSSTQSELSMEDFLFEPSRLEHRTSVHMGAGKSYLVRLITQARIPKENDYEPTPHGAVLGYEEHVDTRACISEAVRVASSSDVSIIFAGRDGQYESEGFDLDAISLPDAQVKLIKAVAAVSDKTVLVLHCGNPIDVTPFIDDVDAVLNAHFPGQEGGQAITNILTGKANPSGRLATTWPKRLDEIHVPTYNNFPAQLTEDGYTLKYEEGIQLGYRHPNAESTARWEFGFGLSYSTFEYTDLVVSTSSDLTSHGDSDLSISVRVKNSGLFPGHDVVQVYVLPPSSSKVWRPSRELKGYAKPWILPGELQTVTIPLDQKHAFSYWDETVCQWRLEAGTYEIVIGSLSATVEVEHGLTWNGR